MEGLVAFVRILLQAPPAILRGRFDVDEDYSVYGLPARLIGVLLLQIVVWAVVDLVYWGFDPEKWDFPAWYLPLRIGTFLGGIMAAALLCVLCRQRRREEQE
jgi:hypothetical protein